MNKPAVQKMTALQMLEKYKPQIAEALPSHVKIDKLVRIISSQISQNPELGMADPTSLMSAVMRCSQLGLEPGAALSRIHLIPRNNRKKNIKEVSVIIGYQGLIELARRSGEITEIYAEAVYENDLYKVTFGLNRNLEHEPFDGDRGKFKAVYAVAKYRDGGIHFITMSKHETEKIRTNPKYPNPIWNDHYSEMAKKTAIRRLAKYLPLSTEKAEQFNTANMIDARIEIDESQNNNQILIDAKIPLPKSEEPIVAAPNMFDKTKALLSEAIKNGFNCKEEFGADAVALLADCKTDSDCITIIEAINKKGDK